MGPKRVKIGPFWFKVTYTDLNKINISDSMGYTSFSKKEIYVDKSYHVDLQAETLLHEIYHVIKWVAGIKKEDDEESVIRIESPLMLGVLRDNPTLVTFLIDGYKS